MYTCTCTTCLKRGETNIKQCELLHVLWFLSRGFNIVVLKLPTLNPQAQGSRTQKHVLGIFIFHVEIIVVDSDLPTAALFCSYSALIRPAEPHFEIRVTMRTMRLATCIAAATTGCAYLPASVEGVPMFVTRIPNGDNVPGVKALGHEDTTGEESVRNVFGIAFEEAGTEWTKELCEADSDEDGQTNGQELGDPCCVWAEGGTPQWSDDVTHPGDASKMSDESLWTNIDCVAIKAQAEAQSQAEANAEASKNEPNEGEDSEVDISTGDDESAATTWNDPLVISTLLLAVIPAVLQLA
ncbi:unnamed protein product [Phytophthora fragariaefolia]|uniref:Unnamed protein product n=1 Tax=Phytophthora fragariaefolia TaxID=1490495 RepID=A0A9W6XF86_9STRA|nr:unnamed protein product [Phytophthora fragariaefolia]